MSTTSTTAPMFDLSTARERAVHAVFKESRNGTNGYTRHPFAKRLLWTSGIEELCETAGAFWLLDVIGTEATPVLLAQLDTGAALGIIRMTVADSKTEIELTVQDDAPPIWKRSIEYTDFPTGEWILYLGCDQLVVPGSTVTVLCLPSEH